MWRQSKKHLLRDTRLSHDLLISENSQRTARVLRRFLRLFSLSYSLMLHVIYRDGGVFRGAASDALFIFPTYIDLCAHTDRQTDTLYIRITPPRIFSVMPLYYIYTILASSLYSDKLRLTIFSSSLSMCAAIEQNVGLQSITSRACDDDRRVLMHFRANISEIMLGMRAAPRESAAAGD